MGAISGTGIIGVFTIVFDVIVRVWALIYIPRNRRPQTALAWILAVFLVPYVGLAFFLLVGNSRLPKARRDKQDTINAFIRRAADSVDDRTLDPDIPDWLKPATDLNRTLGAMPLVPGNSAKVYETDAAGLEAMIDAINAASSVVHAEFYIMSLDSTSGPFFDALENARNRGVVVRVLLDHLGSRGYPGYRAMKKRMDRAGLEWRLMLPFFPLMGKLQRPDLRNHRKLLVIDGTVAFTGSRNIIDPGYQKRKNTKRGLQWHDFMARFEGPVVAEIEAVFISDWYSETDELLDETDVSTFELNGDLDCQVVPSGPGFEGENNLRLFNSLVYAARKRIVLTSPYFVPDDSMLYAITTAAQSGIEVELFVSEIGDQFLVYHAQRSYYEALLKAGVRIWLYSKPTVLHAKHFTIDDELSVFGSSNMDMRSFTLDLEITVMVRGADFMRQLRATQDEYRSHSRELTIEEWSKRSFIQRTFDDLARLTAAVQ
ncbi:cardiolipin synthase [soil metagenome]